MKDFKYWVLVAILTLGVIFVTIDNCGNTTKYNKLKGEYNTHKVISKIVIAESVKTINKQIEEIGKLDEKIDFLQGIIEVKDEDLAEIEEDLGELKREFASLQECQAQYDKLVEGFNLCKSINTDQKSVIFSLNEKYDAQLKVSNLYKSMYKSVQDVLVVRDKQVKELEKINKRLRLTSGLKTGFVVVLAGLIVYNMVK